MAEILIDNASEDIVSEATELSGPAVIVVRGDEFDGALVSFETASAADDAERYDTLDNTTFAAPGTKKVDYSSQSLKIRARLTGSQAMTSNIFVAIDQ